jgi:diacylglycerol kinase family enzyme
VNLAHDVPIRPPEAVVTPGNLMRFLARPRRPTAAEIREGFSSCLLVINPSRYPGYSRILTRAARRIPVPELIVTRDREHFIDSVRDFVSSRYQHLLVWGGDGTAHDAINALATADAEAVRKKSVGFLRGGSGNGIQDSYQVPYTIRRQLESYATSMRNGYSIAVDLLRVGSGTEAEYGQLVGIGFDADVLARREGKSGSATVRSGMGRYVMSALYAFRTLRLKNLPSRTLRLRDGKYAFRGTRVNAEFPIRALDLSVNPVMIEVGTRPYYGRLFKVCPDVVCNDGFMDVYVFQFATRISMVFNLSALWNGHHDKINKRAARYDHPVIQRYEVRSLVVESAEPFPYQLDGELRVAPIQGESGARLEIGVVPSSLNFVVPPAFYRLFHPFESVEGE